MWKPKTPLSMRQADELELTWLISINKKVEPIRRSRASPAISLDVVRLIAESVWEEIVILGEAIMADKGPGEKRGPVGRK